jgi:methyl-accepting chemotaxis protein
MIVICEDCGKKYRIDLGKMKASTGRFKCRVCHHMIMVEKNEMEKASAKQKEDLPKKSELTLDEHLNERQPSADETTSSDGKSKGVRFGLVPKIVAVMLLVSLLPLSTYWLISFKKNSERMRNETEVLSSQITSGLTNHVDEWIDKNVRVLQAIAVMDDMASMQPARQEALLKAVQKAYPWMYLVFTTDRYGQNIARSDGKPLKDYSDRQYYQNIMSGKSLTWQTLIGKTSKKPALVLAIPIKRNGRLVGVLANAMKIDDISKRIATWKQGKTGFAFLVDEKGKVVAHQVQDYVNKQKNLSQHPLVSALKKGQSGNIYFRDENGDTQMGNVRRTKYGWALAIQQLEKEAFQALKKDQQFAYLLLTVTVIVVCLIAWFSGRTIVAPIQRLTDAADRISIGELDVEIKLNSKDEIAALGNAIARMQDSIRLSIERLRRRR